MTHSRFVILLMAAFWLAVALAARAGASDRASTSGRAPWSVMVVDDLFLSDTMKENPARLDAFIDGLPRGSPLLFIGRVAEIGRIRGGGYPIHLAPRENDTPGLDLVCELSNKKSAATLSRGDLIVVRGVLSHPAGDVVRISHCELASRFDEDADMVSASYIADMTCAPHGKDIPDTEVVSAREACRESRELLDGAVPLGPRSPLIVVLLQCDAPPQPEGEDPLRRSCTERSEVVALRNAIPAPGGIRQRDTAEAFRVYRQPKSRLYAQLVAAGAAKDEEP